MSLGDKVQTAEEITEGLTAEDCLRGACPAVGIGSSSKSSASVFSTAQTWASFSNILINFSFWKKMLEMNDMGLNS